MRVELNVKRLLCPMPVIKAQDKAKDLNEGDTLEVIATDPGTLYDIPSWARMYGHQILSTSEDDGIINIVIKVGKKD